MHKTHRSRSLAILGGLAAMALAVPALTGVASAHEKPGATCAMSGMSMIHKGEVQTCVSTGTAKPTWSKVMKSSKSALTITDGWAKAADSGMTAVFGTLKNPTKKPIRVVAAHTVYSPTQLHEVVDKDGKMVMQQKPGGFVIPAGGSLELMPGGNHVMLMKLKKPITAGAMVPITFITADGGLLTTKVLGKVFAAANETYDGSGSMDMSSHDMG